MLHQYVTGNEIDLLAYKYIEDAKYLKSRTVFQNNGGNVVGESSSHWRLA